MTDASRTPPGRQHPDGADAGWTDLSAAAARLGISPDATRKRLERGTLRGEKRSGRWSVWLPDLDRQPDTPDAAWTPPDATEPDASGQSDATRTPPDAAPDTARELIDHLKAENDYLREELAQRSRELAAERERFDVLHREALGRIPALSTGDRPDDRGSGETMSGPSAPAPAPSLAHSAWRRWWERLVGR